MARGLEIGLICGLTLSLVFTACGYGGSRDAGGERSTGRMGRGGMMGSGRMMGGAADTGAAPRARGVAASAMGCPDISQELVDTGRGILSGDGNCYSCHGSDARGTALAPDLTDSMWLDIDGSYSAIAGLVQRGVPDPKVFPSPMPAMGGAQLDSVQVCAVAAYVYSLGHRER